ncbi:MAG: 30S ribosomal protein S8 [Candidatus Wildermuthbacteria bacterium RIFCSPHIGHO2_01_FULL_48_25]|uniref:Small ribosomal subunit protein uS8 n=1 Tax=Candidatus Wildermuthbacteria bacterium RIFCSPLOWO2_01_FULL_48_16 TaxID=1802461 RepID=A0A1G2RKV2_9BACT|nr:MAG: 30S ribosomal protein S8 [Candidatus Wildermuthbacteria bacterium RIFCSPHIGHO2_01_FULL_48_25]OHA69062.1 MAG: 30S ribosomal protein S8 [Candidatus Wildermuthbacteria bacterium RIFCSPHIGHO2_02_FULL_49_12b]OHA73473.1 MAG: 30S ribosomal protein S8 [Candidatus Wildermuthbacteria bacterium RIFCSPLOWO2_01_FULL_48_16]
MTDPIADMLTQIRNASLVLKETIELPYSKMRLEIAKILEKEGLIVSSQLRGRRARKFLELTLKYDGKAPAISGLKRVSKPGQRIYVPFSKIKKVKGGFGISIISTSKGLLSNKEAWNQKVGGEVICEVW